MTPKQALLPVGFCSVLTAGAAHGQQGGGTPSNAQNNSARRVWPAAIPGGVAIFVARLATFLRAGDQPAAEVHLVEVQGIVEVSSAGADTWVLTQSNQVLHPSRRLMANKMANKVE
jgi:hypothetical protein